MTPMYKVFCVLCDWYVVTDDEQKLWGEYSKCPTCLGATDGIKMDFPKQLPKPRPLA